MASGSRVNFCLSWRENSAINKKSTGKIKHQFINETKYPKLSTKSIRRPIKYSKLYRKFTLNSNTNKNNNGFKYNGIEYLNRELSEKNQASTTTTNSRIVINQRKHLYGVVSSRKRAPNINCYDNTTHYR